MMTKYRDTEEAHQRSRTYHASRMSEREGLGPHIHLSGPKTYQQFQQEMEEQLRRPVNLGEVFIKTHTRADVSFVDLKVEKIDKSCEKNLQDKLSELEPETSNVSEAASRPWELSAYEYNLIFLQSTEKDSRETSYGVGNLRQTLVSGKHKQPGDSSQFIALQDQFKEAQRKIEEQVAYNERLEAEHS